MPFLLLVVVSISVLGYEIYESLDFDAEALNQCMNNSIDKIIVGVEDLNQLKKILNLKLKKKINIPDHLKSNDKNLINPSNWVK